MRSCISGRRRPPKTSPAATPYVMGTRRKQFVPRVLPITVGSQVRFPNQDPILHNAFSTSKDNSFDVGLYGEGEGQTRDVSITSATCACTAMCITR